MATPQSVNQRAVLVALAAFGGGLLAIVICALLSLPSAICVCVGLGAMLGVRRWL